MITTLEPGRRYWSRTAAHESLEATIRCLMLYQPASTEERVDNLLKWFGVSCWQELSPFGANCARRQLDQFLPLRGDFA